MGCVSDATFSKLAGVSPADDHDGVPSIDSIDQCKSTHIECAPYCRSCTIIAGHLGCILPRAPAIIVRDRLRYLALLCCSISSLARLDEPLILPELGRLGLDVWEPGFAACNPHDYCWESGLHSSPRQQ